MLKAGVMEDGILHKDNQRHSARRSHIPLLANLAGVVIDKELEKAADLRGLGFLSFPSSSYLSITGYAITTSLLSCFSHYPSYPLAVWCFVGRPRLCLVRCYKP